MNSKSRICAAVALALLATPAAFAQQGSGPAPALPAGAATPAQPPGGVTATQSATQTPSTTDQAQVGRSERRTQRAVRNAKDKVK